MRAPRRTPAAFFAATDPLTPLSLRAYSLSSHARQRTEPMDAVRTAQNSAPCPAAHNAHPLGSVQAHCRFSDNPRFASGEQRTTDNPPSLRREIG